MNGIWIKKNQKLLIGLAIILAFVVITIPVWLHEAEKHNLDASEAYSKAISGIQKDKAETLKTAREALEKMIASYSDSKVARLAALHMASLSVELKEPEKAKETYENLLQKLSPQDPLRPLAISGLHLVYETLKKPEKAQEMKTELEKIGFVFPKEEKPEEEKAVKPQIQKK